MIADIVVRRIAAGDCARLSGSFADLCRRSDEPNPHMSPAAIAAATVLVHPESIVVLGAWQSEALGIERLVGLWAMRRGRGWRSGFASVLTAPVLPLYEVSSLPVLDRDHGAAALAAMLRHIRAAGLPRTLALPLLPMTGPTTQALRAAVDALGATLHGFEHWERPMMIPLPGDTAESYLRRSLGGGFKKRMQQQRALGRQGDLVFRRHRGTDAVAAFERFLMLEASGWKGAARTAIASRPADTHYFRELVSDFAAVDGVQIDALTLDGRDIAMGLLVEAGGTRHFLKIAYDEDQARHSPGRALTIAMIEADFAGRPAAIFDSGAGDGVDAATYPWGETRPMANPLLTLPGTRALLPRAGATARMELRRLRARLAAFKASRAARAPSAPPPA